MEPPAAIECAEWIHGPAHYHKVHFLLVDGTPPNCARDVKPDPDGYGAGLEDLSATGCAVCMQCCSRLGSSADELDALMHALNS